MSISGYASLMVTKKFSLKASHTISISRSLPSESYVQALYKRHWPIHKNQTYTQPIQLRNGELMYSDPTVVSGDFVTRYERMSKNIDHVVSLNGAVNDGKESWYRVALFHRPLQSFFLREMNHHPDSSQHFFHHESQMPFLILLAPPKTELDPSSVMAYVLNQHENSPQGLVIAPGVWHSPPIPLVNEMVPHGKVVVNKSQHIFTQQTRSHNCILWDSLCQNEAKWLLVDKNTFI